jgi:hypothetical protein
MDTLPRAFAGACKIIGLVQEPHGSLSSPAEFAAYGGKFSFSGEVGAETDVSAQLYCPPLHPGCEAATGDRGRNDSGVPESQRTGRLKTARMVTKHKGVLCAPSVLPEYKNTLQRAFSGPGFLPQCGKKCAQISEVKGNYKDVRQALRCSFVVLRRTTKRMSTTKKV